jgi:hypothetical protein
MLRMLRKIRKANVKPKGWIDLRKEPDYTPKGPEV